MDAFLKLLAKYPDTHCRIFDDEYQRAKDELDGYMTPFFDPEIARAIVLTWEALQEQVQHDVDGPHTLCWFQVFPDGTTMPSFTEPNQDSMN